MDACPLLITSIVAVKPEDQGTFFQDFLGLSGYLCSIGGFYSNTALLRTRNAQNHNEAQRLALPALGRTGKPRPSGKRLRRRKLLEMAQNPQRPVHAVLGAFYLRYYLMPAYIPKISRLYNTSAAEKPTVDNKFKCSRNDNGESS